MKNIQLRQTRDRIIWISLLAFGFSCVLFLERQAFAQVDQGAITGVVTDSAGAVIPGAQVTLTDTDTGLILHGQADGSGVYVFSPVKIGNYNISATASGFQTTFQEHLHVDIQERLNVVIALKPGAVSQTVTVSTAPPLLQSQSASVGQVMSTQTINNTPLNGRNWVYIAQLSAGVAPSTSTGGTSVLSSSRGAGTGDFFANGQRATQNDFILDGVDNNVNVADFMNGATYNVRPPPDALAEFKIDTSNYSAEFGHSAGAVVNASIKSGTNQVHGDLWEYLRNTDLDAKDWNETTIPPYHENQFGATLGFPILRNKLFYFGDAEANRIVDAQVLTLDVPTPLMRQGNFTELLNTSLTGSAQPTQLYQPNSGGTAKLSCNGQNNVFCASQMDPIATNLLNMFPNPNAKNGETYNNLVENLPISNNTWQWDQRMDWNISGKDQFYVRYSYQHELFYDTPPFGNILSGQANYPAFMGTYSSNLSESFMASESHLFSPSLTNEFRVGYNYGHFTFLSSLYNTDVSAQLGVGGVPFGPDSPDNGGLPYLSVTGLSPFGPQCCTPSIEGQNIYQILDNVTKNVGNHSLKFGVFFENIRTSLFQPSYPTGHYTYSGLFTSNLGASFTGSGVADFLANQMDSGSITTDTGVSDYRWYESAYAQDDWRPTSRLTLNLGLRWDFFQPRSNAAGDLTNLVPTPPFGGIGTGTGTLLVPAKNENASLFPAAFLNLLAANNITIKYIDSVSLVTAPKDNFAPRLGFAYQADPKSVIRGGFGIFFGGLESIGGSPILVNYPWEFTSAVLSPNCSPNNCASDGITFEEGFTKQLANGFNNFISTPTFNIYAPAVSTPYTMSYNLTVERELSTNLAATLGYVGNLGRDLMTGEGYNDSDALLNPSNNSQLTKPFPGITGGGNEEYVGRSAYNALQAKLQKSYSNGLNFLAAYTWGHATDDSANGLESGIADRNTNLIPLIDEYTNSAFDLRHRFTFNGFYELPFGKGRTYMHNGEWSDKVAGGWTTSLTFFAQTGYPFTVTPNIATAAGGTARAILIGNPFAAGGSPPPSNPGIACAPQTKNKTNWYNPCAFGNPLPGSQIPLSGPGSQVTGTANAIGYLGGKSEQIAGPGFERVDISLFKNFQTFRTQYLQFRIDSFNLMNHPTFNTPSINNNNSNGGAITQSQIFQNNMPDSRFFQISAKYVF